MEKKPSFRWDAVVLLSLLLLAAGLYLLFQNGSETGTQVVVRVAGEEVGRYSLLTNATYSLNGGTNTLVIENGTAYLSWADCPDRLCVKQGKISRTGECITCLPNRLTVTVYGGSSGVDLIS